MIVLGAISAEKGGSPALIVVGVVLIIPVLIIGTGFVIVAPGQTSVRQFFGRYIGTVRQTGLVLVPPLIWPMLR